MSEMATVGYPLPYAHVIWVALLRLGALKIKNRAGKKIELGVVAHTCNSSPWEARGSGVPGQSGLHRQTNIRK